MKTSINIKLITSFAIISFAYGCNKPEYPNPSVSTNTPQTANMLFVNALSTVSDSTFDLYVNNLLVESNVAAGTRGTNVYTKVDLGPQLFSLVYTGASISAGTALSSRPVSSSSSISYTSTLTGSALTVAGVSSAMTKPALFPNTNYTFIAQGVYGKRSGLILDDDMSAPASGKVKLRLVNAAPSGIGNALLDTTIGTGSGFGSVLPIGINGGTLTGWTNIITGNKILYNASASNVQSFSQINPSLNLSVYGGPLLSTVSGMNSSAVPIGNPIVNTLQPGGIYTIVVFKKAGALTYSIIRHDQ